MQEHEPWEIGEMRKKTSNYRDRAGRTELKRVRSSTHNGDIKALCHVEIHHQRPREFLLTVLIHRLPSYSLPHRFLTALPSYRLIYSPSHRLTDTESFLTVFPHRSTPNLTVYRLSSPIPSYRTVTELPLDSLTATHLFCR